MPLRAKGRIPHSWISASRITMVIDPALPPEYVADFYQSIRKSADFYGDTKVRPLTERALLLAAFSATTDDNERAADQVRRWNAQHPEHAYDENDSAAVSNFRRDYKQARERLLHPKLGRQILREMVSHTVVDAHGNPVTPPPGGPFL